LLTVQGRGCPAQGRAWRCRGSVQVVCVCVSRHRERSEAIQLCVSPHGRLLRCARKDEERAVRVGLFDKW